MRFTINENKLLVCSEEKRLKEIANKYYNSLDCSNIIAPNDEKILTVFLSLVKEYICLVKSDLDNYEFDFSPYVVDYMKTRNEQDKKYEQICVYYHYLIYTLGEFSERFISNIDSNYKRKLYSPKFDIFDMSDMLNEAIVSLKKDISFQKSEIRHSFGSTLIFQTMIERNLQISIMTYLQEHYVEKLMNASKTQIKFTENEVLFIRTLYDYFNFDKPLNYPGNRKELYNQLFDLLKKYDMLPHNKKQLKATKQLLVDENYTIGSLLHNAVYIQITNENFYELLNILYDVNKLNIRNNIAHCNFEIYNCYEPKISSILFFINTLIISNKIYKVL